MMNEVIKGTAQKGFKNGTIYLYISLKSHLQYCLPCDAFGETNIRQV